MSIRINNILIIANYSKDEVTALIDEISAYFSARKVGVSVFPYEKDVPEEVLSKMDMAFSLGGDGTLLRCARVLINHKIPILGINLGDFGFITEISKAEWIPAFEKYISGMLGISERIMVNVRLVRNGQVISEKNGLNEAVIRVNGLLRLVNLRTFSGSTYIGRYRADGIIVATPTGSTAYSMSAEGPILHPEMDAMILVPICPFTLSNRPLVVPGNEIIRIIVDDIQRTAVLLTVDGEEHEALLPHDEVIIRKYEHKTRIINSDKRNFYEVLRTKLNWSGEPHA
jgi:NAD+ kinase